jgi:TonB family protein
MPGRVFSYALASLLLSLPAAAQEGQGANARPDATPPTRPSMLTPPGPLERWMYPGPIGGARAQNLLLVYPSIGFPQQSGEPVYQMGNGVTSPVRTKSVDPVYTERAKAAKIQGEVWIDAIVEKDGSLTVQKVTRSLDPDLDQKAVEAAKQWQFNPGTRAGQPVRVQVQIILEFRLRSDSSSTPASTRSGLRGDGTPVQVQLGDEEFRKGAYQISDPGVVAPKVKFTPDAKYTSDAMRAKLQGEVKIEAVVLPDGTVGRARVVESLDKVLGLDDNALATAQQWTFEPGTLNGQPVPVLVTLTMTFRLH